MKYTNLNSSKRRSLLKAGALVGVGSIGLPLIANNAFANDSLKGKRVGYSMSFSTIEWLVAQRRGVVETAKKFGFDLVVADANDNPSKQVLDLEDFVTKDMDMIIISTYYADAITSAVREINEAGIPIVVISSSLSGNADWTCRIATDNLATARKAGEYYVNNLPEGAKVVHIDGKPGSMVNQERTKGWQEVISKSSLELVGHAVANYERSEALRAMEDFLQGNSEINAVYCNNDDMALGAMQAARESDRLKDMMITGYDGIQPEVMKAIYNGDMRGTWQYPPMGAEGVEAAAAILSGKELPKEILFASPMITKENVLDFWDKDTNQMKLSESLLKV